MKIVKMNNKKRKIRLKGITMILMMIFLAVPFSTALQISDFTVDVDGNSATASWKTDEASDATVIYGKSDASLEDEKNVEELVTEHSVDIDDLEPKTEYNLKAKSCTESSCTESEIMTITTEESNEGEFFLDVSFDGNEATDGESYFFNNELITFDVSSLEGIEILLYNNTDLERR